MPLCAKHCNRVHRHNDKAGWLLYQLTYLADFNEQAQNRLELIIEQMKVFEGVTEYMKQHDQMAWVGAMNSIRNRAEEIILREMIYEEDDV